MSALALPRILLSCGLALLGGVSLSLAPPAAASTVVYTLNGCYGNNGNCPAGSGPPWGTVTVTDITVSGVNGVSVDLQLEPGESYTVAGSGGKQALLFDLPYSTIDVTSLNSPPFTLHSPTSGSIMADGTGSWDYGIMCTSCSSGNSNPISTNVTFDILDMTGQNITSTAFSQNGNGIYFATDVAIAGTSFTGDVGSTTRTTVPLPPSLLLLASALLLLGLLSTLRSRTHAVLPARLAG